VLKIDVFSHIMPPKLAETIAKKTSIGSTDRRLGFKPVLRDLDARFRIMDKYENYIQILTMALPPMEDLAPPELAIELAQMANDELAELVNKYPDRFVAAMACLPMNDIDASLKEIDRAIRDLRFRGIQICTTIQDKPLDSPEFEPIFAKMAEYDLPILIHPRHRKSGRLAFEYGGLPGETEGETWGRSLYNWPFETTIALCALVYGGIMQKYPNLKVVSHHCGGTLPYQAGRVLATTESYEKSGTRRPSRYFTKRPYDYAKQFYGDTACYGNTGALMCGYNFFGVDHILFGTDMPFGSEGGRYVRETIKSVDEMNISVEERQKIYEDNARKLFRLPV
jgi:predicted TIM-barrel fold metal-dependent hydrolase